MPTPELVLWPIVGALALLAAIVELRGGQLPRWVAPAGLVVIIVIRGALQGVGGVESGLVTAALGALACAVPFSIFAFAGRRAGWGDVGLMAAVGAGFGIPRALTAVMLISLVGAAAALFFVLRRRRSASVRATDSTEGPRVAVDSGRSIPYGVPIALGALWAMGWAGPTVSDELGPDDEVMVSADGGTSGDEDVGQVEHVE